MIRDYQRYFGAAFVYLLDHWNGPLQIRRAFSDKNGYYILQERIPLAIKFSRSRKGPWTFTYHRDHQILYNELVRAFGNGITAFVCGTDGIVAIEHSQLRKILDEVFEDQENVSIRRRHGHMYAIHGRDGALDEKIGKDSFAKLVERLLKE